MKAFVAKDFKYHSKHFAITYINKSIKDNGSKNGQIQKVRLTKAAFSASEILVVEILFPWIERKEHLSSSHHEVPSKHSKLRCPLLLHFSF